MNFKPKKMKIPVYPIKFEPILKDKVWGGTKLRELLGKKTASEQVGESWEISGVEGNISVVANGELRGKPLNALIDLYKESFFGQKVRRAFGNQFPLLFKFIDAKKDLSVQLHPNDEIAKKRHNSFGKTEMWYIVQADSGSGLYLGFNKPMDKELYLKHLHKNTLEEILHFETAKEGDAYYIPPGRIHAIGGGVLLAEIQQTSDITYRIYDWNRPDIDGKLRELHNDLAMEAIDFKNSIGVRKFEADKDSGNELIVSPYFSSSLLSVSGKQVRKIADVDSFVVYMCVSGEAVICTNNHSETVQTGETILVPAVCEEVEIISERAKLLEVFVP